MAQYMKSKVGLVHQMEWLHNKCCCQSHNSRGRMTSSVDVSFCLDMLPVFSQRYLWHLFFQPAVLQVTTLLNPAGVAHMVDAALAGYTKYVLISIFQVLMLWTLHVIRLHGKQLQQLLSYVQHDDGPIRKFCSANYNMLVTDSEVQVKKDMYINHLICT